MNRHPSKLVQTVDATIDVRFELITLATLAEAVTDRTSKQSFSNRWYSTPPARRSVVKRTWQR